MTDTSKDAGARLRASIAQLDAGREAERADTSQSAVEALAAGLAQRRGISWQEQFRAAAVLRALLAERDAARAERDAALAHLEAVERWDPQSDYEGCEWFGPDQDGRWVHRDEVLAALSGGSVAYSSAEPPAPEPTEQGA